MHIRTAINVFISTFLLSQSCVVATKPRYDEGTWSQSYGVSLAPDAHVMIKGWSSLTPAFSRCQKTFEADSSTEKARCAAKKLVSRIKWVSRRHGRCTNCLILGSVDINSQIHAMVLQFFSSLQSVLQMGQHHYFNEWRIYFTPIFTQCSSAILSLQSITQSFQLDLAVIIQPILINYNVFLSADLDLSAILGVNLRLGHGALPQKQLLNLVPQLTRPQGQVITVDLEKPRTAAITATIGLQSVVEGWSSLTSAFTECTRSFEQNVSVELAIQAMNRLVSSIQAVNSRFGVCAACHQDLSKTASFGKVVVQFFVSLQNLIKIGGERYSAAWTIRFKPVFAQILPAISSLKSLCGSLRIDYGALLQQASVNANLFTSVGLYIFSSSTINSHIVAQAPSAPIVVSTSSKTAVVPSSPSLKVPLATISSPKTQGAAPGGQSPVVAHSVAVPTKFQLVDGIVRGWSSLTPAFSRCQTVFNQRASVDVALEAATTLSNEILQISSQFGECVGCQGAAFAQYNAHFEVVVKNFFLSIQGVLRSGQLNYSAVWESRFKPIFQRCGPAFVSLKSICTSLQIDMDASLGQVNVDYNLFASSGFSVQSFSNLGGGFSHTFSSIN